MTGSGGFGAGTGPLMGQAGGAGAMGAGAMGAGAGSAGAGLLGGAARGLPGGPAVRGMREQLGDQQVSSGGVSARPGFTPTGARIGRNDACWCGSGNKYKKCHGR